MDRFRSGTTFSTIVLVGLALDPKMFHLNHINMGNLLYFIAVILVIGWAIGAFYLSLGGLIHALLVIAAIAVLFRLISGRSA